MYNNGLSDSSIARGDANNRIEKEGVKPKTIQWILITLIITVLFCVITIFILFSKLSTVQNNYSTLEDSVSSLQKQLKTNSYLNPLYFTTSWQKTYSLTPQALDSNLNYTDLYDTSTSDYFTWSSQSGGYGTCEFGLWIKNCPKCQFSVKGTLNRVALYPTRNFTTSTSSSITYLVDFNFVLSQDSNLLGVSLALIGDSSQGPVSVTITNSAYCYISGIQT